MTEPNALADMLGEALICCGEPAHGPHAPWCAPTTLVDLRARVGLPTRPAGTPNRTTFEQREGALLAVFPEET
jgi:hypothetical protein